MVEDNAETSRWNSVVVSFEISGGQRYVLSVSPFPLVMEDAGQMYTYQGGEIFTACTKYVYVSSWNQSWLWTKGNQTRLACHW